MDKRKEKRADTSPLGSGRAISQGDSEENPRSIVAWKSGKYWLIYDQTTDSMTQGKSYQDAIFMLSDLLKEKGKTRCDIGKRLV